MNWFKIFACNVRLVQLYFWDDVVDDFIGGRNDDRGTISFIIRWARTLLFRLVGGGFNDELWIMPLNLICACWEWLDDNLEGLVLDIMAEMGLNIFLGEVGDKCDINPFSCLANNNIYELLDTQRFFRANPIRFL